MKTDKMGSNQLELLQVVPHEIGKEVVEQRIGDGYFNATAMCKVSGKLFANYVENKTTNDFLTELSSDIGIPITTLVQSSRGNKHDPRGTWVHPQVAIHLGQWLSPKFAVLVTKWVFDWMNGSIKVPRLPYHLRRYLAHVDAIPATHFSVLNEMVLSLIAPLERLGYILPEHMIPDISEGKMFANFVRQELGLDPNDFPTYTHRYEDGRKCEAKLYPLKYLPAFREHFHSVWLRERALDYFKKRDPDALDHLKIMIALDTSSWDKPDEFGLPQDEVPF